MTSIHRTERTSHAPCPGINRTVVWAEKTVMCKVKTSSLEKKQKWNLRNTYGITALRRLGRKSTFSGPA